MSEVRHGVVIARIDVTRTLRVHLDRSQLPALVMSLLLVGLGIVGGGYLSYRAGTELRTGGAFAELPVSAAIGGVVALFWLLITVVYLVRAFGVRGSPDATGGLLATVRTRPAVGGILLAEIVYGLLWLTPVALALGVGFALGTESYIQVLSVPLAAIGFTASTVVVGYPIGLALRHLLTRYEIIARNKNALIVLFVAGYIVAFATGSINDLMVQLYEPVQASPMAWFGDLVLLGAPDVTPSPTNAMLVLIVTVLLLPITLEISTRLADIHWFSDPVTTESADDDAEAVMSSEAGRFERVLSEGFDRTTVALIVLAYRRTVRAPFKLLYAAIPLFILLGFIPEIIERGEVPSYLVVVLLLTIVWGGGMLFVLNPFGDQGSVLPATVLSATSGRQFVRAHVVASLLVTLPLGVVLTAGAVIFSPMARNTGVAVVLASPVVILLGSLLAVGLGMAFPRFSAVKVTQSREAVVPSKVAFVTYSLYLAATVLAGAIVYEDTIGELAAGLLSWLLPFGLSIQAETLFYLAALVLVGALLAPVVAYRYAVRRFDEYTIE